MGKEFKMHMCTGFVCVCVCMCKNTSKTGTLLRKGEGPGKRDLKCPNERFPASCILWNTNALKLNCFSLLFPAHPHA